MSGLDSSALDGAFQWCFPSPVLYFWDAHVLAHYTCWTNRDRMIHEWMQWSSLCTVHHHPFTNHSFSSPNCTQFSLKTGRRFLLLEASFRRQVCGQFYLFLQRFLSASTNRTMLFQQSCGYQGEFTLTYPIHDFVACVTCSNCAMCWFRTIVWHTSHICLCISLFFKLVSTIVQHALPSLHMKLKQRTQSPLFSTIRASPLQFLQVVLKTTLTALWPINFKRRLSF